MLQSSKRRSTVVGKQINEQMNVIAIAMAALPVARKVLPPTLSCPAWITSSGPRIEELGPFKGDCSFCMTALAGDGDADVILEEGELGDRPPCGKDEGE